MPSDSYFAAHMGLSEWLRQGKSARSEQFAAEDLTKTDRMRDLYHIIGLPSAHTVTFSLEDILTPTDQFQRFSRDAGTRPYALRLRKSDGSGVLARNRGITVDELVRWARSLGPEIATSAFEFEQHVDAEVAAVFIINEQGMAVETVKGSLSQLSKGHYDPAEAYICQGSVEFVVANASDTLTREFLDAAVDALSIKDSRKLELLRENGYDAAGTILKGYFEAIYAGEQLYFVDYNRVLGTLMPSVLTSESSSTVDQKGSVLLKGRIGSPGEIEGYAHVIDDELSPSHHISPGEILVCRFTSPEFAPLMSVAAGVVTEVGGVLSHAAVLCRELGIPCIVGAEGAVERLRNAGMIVVDANEGEVRLA